MPQSVALKSKLILLSAFVAGESCGGQETTSGRSTATETCSGSTRRQCEAGIHGG